MSSSYRLRMVEVDGAASYSPVRTIARPTEAGGLGLFPNPTRQLALLAGAQADALVQLLDAVGRVVLTASADAAGAAALTSQPT